MWGLFLIKRRSNIFACLYWIVVMAIILLLNQWIVTTFIPSEDKRGWQYGLVGGAKFWMPQYNPIGFFAQYTFGIFAAGFIAWWKVTRAKRHWLFDVVSAVSFVGLVLLLWWKRYPPEPDMSFSFQGQPYFFPLFPGLAAILLATLPFSLITGRLMDNPFARYTAKVSFGLYVWHYLILELMRLIYDEKWSYFGIKNLWVYLTYSVVALLLSYLVATFSYYLIEKPFLKQGVVSARPLTQ